MKRSTKLCSALRSPLQWSSASSSTVARHEVARLLSCLLSSQQMPGALLSFEAKSRTALGILAYYQLPTRLSSVDFLLVFTLGLAAEALDNETVLLKGILLIGSPEQDCLKTLKSLHVRPLCQHAQANKAKGQDTTSQDQIIAQTKETVPKRAQNRTSHLRKKNRKDSEPVAKAQKRMTVRRLRSRIKAYGGVMSIRMARIRTGAITV